MLEKYINDMLSVIQILSIFFGTHEIKYLSLLLIQSD